MSASESPEAKLMRGEAIEGTVGFWKKKKWQLTKSELSIDNHPPIPVKQITHVHSFNKVYQVYTDGVEPVIKLPASKNVRAMARVLTKHIEKRKAKGERFDCLEKSGRLLSSANIWNGGAFLIVAVLALGVAVFLAYVSVLDLLKRPERFLGTMIPLSVMFAISVVLFVLARIKGPRLECFENEVHQVGITGKRTVLRYDEIKSLVSDVTEVIGSNPRTKTKLVLEGPQETIRFNDPRGIARLELKALERLVATMLTEKFWDKIEQGEVILFGHNKKLSKTGLTTKEGSVIPYSGIAEIRMNDGVAHFFRSGETKPFLKIKSKEKNFLPCYNLLLLLSDSKMTYVEFCDTKVKPIFGE